jgi:hypothetical protein
MTLNPSTLHYINPIHPFKRCRRKEERKNEKTDNKNLQQSLLAFSQKKK